MVFIVMIKEFGSELMSSEFKGVTDGVGPSVENNYSNDQSLSDVLKIWLISSETDGVGPSDEKIYSNALCNNNK